MGQWSILIVLLAALIVPIVMARFNIRSVPTAVAEILIGIVLGKSAFNIISDGTQIKLLSDIGVVLLMFLSGMEIDVSALLPRKGRKNVDPAAGAVMRSLQQAVGLINADEQGQQKPAPAHLQSEKDRRRAEKEALLEQVHDRRKALREAAKQGQEERARLLEAQLGDLKAQLRSLRHDRPRDGGQNQDQGSAAGMGRRARTPLAISLIAFGSVVAVSALIAVLLHVFGLFSDIPLAIILFSTIALGVVIATLTEKGILSQPIGQTILLTAVWGEVIPLLALTIYASVRGGQAGHLWLIILLFVAAILLLLRFRGILTWFDKVTKATTQLDIRLAFFLVFTLVVIATTVGAENILGAFLAGIVMRLLHPSEATRSKLTSIGYGFFIPIFFIMTGVRLDVRSLFGDPRDLLLLPVLIAGFLLAKMGVFVAFRLRFGARNSLASAFLTATTITLVVPSLNVARNLKIISQAQSSAFVLAAVVVCIAGPILFNSLYRQEKSERTRRAIAILGANGFTYTAARDLADQFTDWHVATDRRSNFRLYDSQIPDLLFEPALESQDQKTVEGWLRDHGFFDVDVFVASLAAQGEVNDRLALLAKQNGVPRVIEWRDSESDTAQKLRGQGIEVFNAQNVAAAAMRAIIESPAAYQLLSNASFSIFEARVRNDEYAGKELADWDMSRELTVTLISRNHRFIIPHGATVVEPGDVVFISGRYEVAQPFVRLLERG